MKNFKLVLCAGGREYYGEQKVDEAMSSLRALIGDFAVLQGGATGGDYLCKQWAIRQGLPVLQVDPNWGKYGKAAGAIRNSWMLEVVSPDYAVFFPGGVGTADMLKKVKSVGIPFWEPCVVDVPTPIGEAKCR